jgi:hypothetical protein
MSKNDANADIRFPNIPKVIQKMNLSHTSENLHSFLNACVFTDHIGDSFSVKQSRSFYIQWPFVPSVKPIDASRITSLILE